MAAAGKVQVHFRPIGNAPIMRRNKFRVDGRHKFAAVVAFLRKLLKLKDAESLVVYCNSAFAPSPEARVADLAACFQVEGELILNYCPTEAWG